MKNEFTVNEMIIEVMYQSCGSLVYIKKVEKPNI
jgi:hypothetical protein